MPRGEHYTKNTVWASAWCAKCGKSTPHRVNGVRKGACLTCVEKLEAEHGKEKPKPPEVQEKLF